MAKLRSTPIALTITAVVAIISGIACFIGLFILVVCFLKREEPGLLSVYAAVYGGLGCGLLGCLYYIAKAACVYLESKE